MHASSQLGIRRVFITVLTFISLFLVANSAETKGDVKKNGTLRPNVLMITLDDMNWDSLGCTGCKVPGISPNIDKLAGEGMRFLHSHVTIAVCQPTRSVWFTGGGSQSLKNEKNGRNILDTAPPPPVSMRQSPLGAFTYTRKMPVADSIR